MLPRNVCKTRLLHGCELQCFSENCVHVSTLYISCIRGRVECPSASIMSLETDLKLVIKNGLNTKVLMIIKGRIIFRNPRTTGGASGSFFFQTKMLLWSDKSDKLQKVFALNWKCRHVSIPFEGSNWLLMKLEPVNTRVTEHLMMVYLTILI